MPSTNARFRELAMLALGMANRDIAAATRLLSEWSGISLGFALLAIEEVAMLEEPAKRGDLIEDEPL
jgi:hypothetical protein